MEFNRMISLVLGFIVLILLFVWIASRFRSSTRTTADNKVTVTVTMTPTPTVTPTKGPSKGWNPLAFLFNNNSPTPTPTQKIDGKKATVTPTSVPVGTTQTGSTQGTVSNGSTTFETSTIVYKNNKTGNTTSYKIEGVQQIPQTGASTLVIPLALSALSFGAYLKKRS